MLDLGSLRPLQAMAASLFFKHRRLLLVLPRQEGKTELGVRLGYNCIAQKDPITGLFIAKDTKSARRATREKFLRIYDREEYSVNTDRIVKKSNPRAVINIASVDRDSDRLRGGTYHFLHWSEAAFSKFEHGETIVGVLDKILNPTTKIFNAYWLIETTTNGKNGFHDLWDNAKDFGFHKFLISYTQMLEMGLVTLEEYERVRDTTHPLVFAQEYECQFVTFQGRAYDEFNESIHVADVPAPKDWQKVVCAIDWGYDPSATSVLFGYVVNGHLYIFDEIYEKRLLLDATYEHMKARMERWSITSMAAVADHEEDRIDELNLRGIPCGKANKSNVLGTRIQIKEFLWKNQITIDPRCQYLIRDLQTAVWHDKKEGDLDYSQCTYGHFDSEAALRYLIRELGKFEIEEPEFNPHTDSDPASARAWNLSRMRYNQDV